MSGLYEGLGTVTEVVGSDGPWVTVPDEVIKGSPMRIANLPVDEVAFASSDTVMRDKKTGALLLDTADFMCSFPTTAQELQSRPAVMRVAPVAANAALNGYVVDYRYVSRPTYRDSGLEDGTDSPRFQEFVQESGTVFPVGAVFNVGQAIRYAGQADFLPATVALMRRVDEHIKSQDMAPYVCTLPLLDRDVAYARRATSGSKPAAGEVERPGSPVTLQALIESGASLAGSLVKVVLSGTKPLRR